jgi:hypothetical protein
MSVHVKLKNSAGIIRDVKVGFSWTAFFFGGFPFFFRGMPLYGLCWILLASFTCGISNLFLMFMINKITGHYYLEHGYEPIGDGWDTAARKWGLDLPETNRSSAGGEHQEPKLTLPN